MIASTTAPAQRADGSGTTGTVSEGVGVDSVTGTGPSGGTRFGLRVVTTGGSSSVSFVTSHLILPMLPPPPPMADPPSSTENRNPGNPVIAPVAEVPGSRRSEA